MSPKDLKEEYPDVEQEILEFLSDDDEDYKAEEDPMADEDFSNVIVVDNLPKVPQSKYDKLIGVLKKVYSKTGTIQRLEMPQEDEKTLGLAFVEFESAEEAMKAVKLTDGYPLDKAHILKVNPYSMLQTVADLKETWEPRPQPDFTPRLNPHAWLADPSHRDQLSVRYNNETEIFWIDRHAPPKLDYGGEREKEGGLYWCELYVQWSPQGSYFATFHNKGIALWGDAEFSKQGRFAHQNVKIVDFSPNENYMITSNNRDDKRGVVVWDVRQKKEIRSFEHAMIPTTLHHASGGPQSISLDFDTSKALGILTPAAAERGGAPPGPTTEIPPPPQQQQQKPPTPKELARFSWSHDDQYCARRGVSQQGQIIIQVYELPTMNLLGRKSLKADGVVDFQWCPGGKRNLIAYWSPESEQGNTPARVTLVEIPSRTEVRQRNLVHVSDCKLFWHPDGEYLCVQVLRHTKSKKTLFTSFELFRVNEPLVPVENLEMKHPVYAFAWEPNGGHRFAIIHGSETSSSNRPDVTFYSMLHVEGKNTKKELVKLFTLEHRPCNSLFWSPAGNGRLVLAGIGDGFDGALEFYDVDHKWSKQSEHYRCTHVAWDPSGRIVATSVVQPLEGAFFKFQMDNGYKLWTFQGQQFHDASFENMYQLCWRPRPKSLLDQDQKKMIVKNLRKYERRFAHEDKLQENARQRELSKEKRKQRAQYRNLVKHRASVYDQSRAQRARMRNGVDVDADDLYIVTTTKLESVLTTKEELC